MYYREFVDNFAHAGLLFYIAMKSGNFKELQQYWNSMQEMMSNIDPAIEAKAEKDDKKDVADVLSGLATWAIQPSKTKRLRKRFDGEWENLYLHIASEINFRTKRVLKKNYTAELRPLKLVQSLRNLPDRTQNDLKTTIFWRECTKKKTENEERWKKEEEERSKKEDEERWKTEQLKINNCDIDKVVQLGVDFFESTENGNTVKQQESWIELIKWKTRYFDKLLERVDLHKKLQVDILKKVRNLTIGLWFLELLEQVPKSTEKDPLELTDTSYFRDCQKNAANQSHLGTQNPYVIRFN